MRDLGQLHNSRLLERENCGNTRTRNKEKITISAIELLVMPCLEVWSTECRNGASCLQASCRDVDPTIQRPESDKVRILPSWSYAGSKTRGWRRGGKITIQLNGHTISNFPGGHCGLFVELARKNDRGLSCTPQDFQVLLTDQTLFETAIGVNVGG